MRLFFALLLVFVAGCRASVHPPVYHPYGAIHEIVASYGEHYSRGYEFGTGFAIDEHRVLTASHVINWASSVTIDGKPARILRASLDDSEPAILEASETFSIFLPTATAVDGPGEMRSIYGVFEGDVSAGASSFDQPGIGGESGSPIIQNGAAIGVARTTNHRVIFFEDIR